MECVKLCFRKLSADVPDLTDGKKFKKASGDAVFVCELFSSADNCGFNRVLAKGYPPGCGLATGSTRFIGPKERRLLPIALGEHPLLVVW